MKVTSLGRVLAFLGWLSLATSTPAFAAGSAAPQRRAESVVADVALGKGGSLSGQLVDAQGKPLARQAVLVARSGKIVARATTSQDGRFQAAGLAGGVYQVAAGNSAASYRLWADRTAPPTAQPSVLLVSGPIVRGQRALSEVLTSDGFVIGLLIAAAIAIPVAVNAAEDEDGS
jgi:hypothetical protein